jgi:hypothetical protein
MPNLDNIFNKFFPQSQTTAKGKFLLKMAWGVEILVALIGLCIGIIIIRGAQGASEVGDLISRGVSLDDLTFGMIFIIVAVVELTKIPLANAVYYSVRLFWRIVFLIALLLVNVSTFETIITGFERINRERSKIVDKLIVEYQSVKTQIQNINENVEVNDVNEEISELVERRSDINKQISLINLEYSKQIQNVKDTSSAQGNIDQLKNEIKELNKKIENLVNANIQLSSQKDSKVFGSNKKSIAESINQNNLRIERHEDEKRAKESELKNLITTSNKDNEGQIDIIKEENKTQLISLNEEKSRIENEIKILEEEKLKYQLDDKEKVEKVIQLKDRKNELITLIDEQAPDNQVFRVATWLKGWFEVDYNKEIEKLNLQVFALEKQKVESITEKSFFDKIFSFFNNKELDNEAIDSQISRLKKQIKDFENKAEIAATTVQESVYADLPRAALTAAFWLWFGVLGFIISITGTMLAFASLVLLDPRLHVIRNKKTAYWKGVSLRISKFFVLLNKYIWGLIKRFRDPKVEIKEIEVEKVVEKIIEKPVEVEKVVIKEVEVPKEIETLRKEIVYVPLPTDDEELLKKGPFNAIDYDKDKKK